MHSKMCLPTYNLVSVLFSAIEISTILAIPNVTKTNDIWKKTRCFRHILEGSITPQSNQNTF